MADKALVALAIEQEEALERVAKVAQRRQLAEEDAKNNRRKIDLKMGEQIKAAFKVGLTAAQISREAKISVPRVYQLRNMYQAHLNQEYGTL